jgi:mono/diheme cytochrome c family protein
MCHGEKGKGKGGLSTEMNIAPPDFTNPDVLGKRTDGELFAIIGKGSTPMPGEGKRLTERQTWDLVNYLRALEGKTPATATAEEREKAKEAHTVVVPH